MNNLRSHIRSKWDKLVDENSASKNTSYVKLWLETSTQCMFYLAIDALSNMRMLIIESNSDNILQSHKYPDISGLEIWPKYENGKTKIFLKVFDAEYNDIFESLCLDLIGEVSDISDGKKCIDRFFYKLHVWKEFFKNLQNKVFDKNEAQGLFGELYFLSQICTRYISLSNAVQYWEGPSGAEHDFKYKLGNVEVKTYKNKNRLITISNVNQLDNNNCGNLCLLCMEVNIGKDATENKINLPSLVSTIRKELESTPEIFLFDQKLLQTGYIEYSFNELFFKVVNTKYYSIDKYFPRLISSNVPNAVKNVKYSLDLNMCNNFTVNESDAFSVLLGTHYAQ